MSILKTIDSPADLKRVPVEQRPVLAEEIREQIISVASAVGGHLSSNLGVVELTLALHYLLGTPKDKIVWDTSNQAYAHKLLTGRREHFHTLRQYGGLSGFCKREESIYDTFNAGHAGTGVSAAIGMAAARDLAEQHHQVLCVVADGAMIVHLITKKGKGYKPAMKDTIWFHACPSFVRETGQPAKSSTKPSYTAVAVKTLCRLAREDRRIVAITAAMCEGTGLTAFAREFPDRFHDVGIAEQHALTFAAGLATQGVRPVVAMYSTFLQRAFDQGAHDVATQNLPVTILIDRGGLVAEDGTTHHGAFDYAYLRHVPNMVVMAPKDENELQHMVKTCLSYEGPASVRYSRGSAWGVPMDPEPKALPIGKAELLQEGYVVGVVAIGITVLTALDAAERLAVEGISAAVVIAGRV